MIHFEVPGIPVAKARPRFVSIKTRSGKTFTHAYTPKKTANYENLVKMAFEAAKPDGFTPLAGPVSLKIIVALPIPASFSKKKREEATLGLISPLIKPDCDNYLKIFADALNGLAYLDDKQVVSATVVKSYFPNPGASVVIDWPEPV
jgi:Holliday junction resolvase RusA-like endonuclease